MFVPLDLDWRQAFLAVSTLVGEPLDIALASLDKCPGGPEGDLASPSRAARAAAAARVAVVLVAELERARLA